MKDIRLMAQAQTVAAALPVPGRSLVTVTASVAAISIPWVIWLYVGNIYLGIVGGAWDLSWHMSIGRDTFWTVPHILMQTEAVVGAVICLYVILTTTLAAESAERQASVRILGLRGPGGAFIAFWGSIAMVASAPIDNWWHNAYGLDSLIITPPHMLSVLGYFVTQVGAMAWVAGLLNRSGEALQRRLAWLLLIVGA